MKENTLLPHNLISNNDLYKISTYLYLKMTSWDVDNV